MAKRSAQDIAAAKAKKQKIILVVGAVLLLAVAALQGPKLMKGSGSSATPPPSAAVSSGATPTPVAAVAAPATGSVVVAGVALPGRTAVKVETNQLASFTLFETKDPFVQKVDDGTGATVSTETSTSDPGTSTTGADASGGSSATSSTADTTPAAPPAPVVYATIDFNTKPQQLEVKGTFPKAEPLFVLRSLTKKQAKIGVAGGSFDGGKAITLKLGKKVTLVNTATGVRYVLKLVYTGVQPEAIEGFTTANGAAAAGAATKKTP